MADTHREAHLADASWPKRLAAVLLSLTAVVGVVGLGTKSMGSANYSVRDLLAGGRAPQTSGKFGPRAATGLPREALVADEVQVVQNAAAKVASKWEAPSAPSWIFDDYVDFATSATTTAAPGTPRQNIKLFCFAILSASDVLSELMVEVIAKKLGIASCDDWTIVSDSQLHLSAGSETPVDALVVDVDLSTSHGAAANVREFSKVWQAIANDGNYQRADFIVKVDPDTVFFPDRLRDKLRQSSFSATDPVFFANCVADVDLQAQEHARFMYGPIEVFSKAAVEAYFRNKDQCKGLRVAGDYEESFMTRCLLKLNVAFNTDMNFPLLQDEHCQQGRSASPCVGGSVAFHNFSSVQDWLRCWSEAQKDEDATEVVRKRQK